MLRRDRASVALRDQVILDALRERPWSSARALSDHILHATGGPPVTLNRSVRIPAWTMFARLRSLQSRGLVQRRTISPRTVWWHTT